jgi:hypothetical protein
VLENIQVKATEPQGVFFVTQVQDIINKLNAK